MNVETLRRAVESIEKALDSAPNNLELMTSLATAYSRLGWFNADLRRLCEIVLEARPESATLQSSLSIVCLLDGVQEFVAEPDLRQFVGPAELVQIENSINALVDEYPHSADLHRALGDLLILNHKPDVAIEQYQEAVTCGLSDPGLITGAFLTLRSTQGFSPEALLFFAHLMDQVNLTDRAMKLYQDLLDGNNLEPQDAERLLELYREKHGDNLFCLLPATCAKLLILLERPEEALEAMDHWDPKIPLDERIVLALAQSLVEHGHLEPAFDLLKRIPMSEATEGELNRIADELERVGEFDAAAAAVRYLNESRAAEPPAPAPEESKPEYVDVQTHLQLAGLNLKKGRYGRYLQSIAEVLKAGFRDFGSIYPDLDAVVEKAELTDPAPLIAISAVLLQEGDRVRAGACIRKAIEIRPEGIAALEGLARLHESELAENPDQSALRLELANLYLKTKHPEKAEPYFSSVESVPDLAGAARRGLAACRSARGEHREALDIWRGLTPRADDLPDLYELATRCRARGLLAEALEALLMVRNLNPGYREVAALTVQVEEELDIEKAKPILDPKMQALIGDITIGRYQYIGEIGSGPLADVHIALFIERQKEIAIKVFHEGLPVGEEIQARYFQEARRISALKIPRLAEIIDTNVGEATVRGYVAMELVEGASLREILAEESAQADKYGVTYLARVCGYVVQAAEGLQQLHAKAVHGNIKPENILVREDDAVKLTDFALGDLHWEVSKTPAGLRYMSPEQIENRKAAAPSDVYSLAIVLYEALTGSPPFISGNIARQHAKSKPIAPCEINPAVPRSISDLILTNLAKDPEDRQSAGDFAKGLAVAAKEIPEAAEGK